MSEQLRQLQEELKAQVYKAPALIKPQTPVSTIKESRFEMSQVSRAPPLVQTYVHHHTRHLLQFMNA